MKDHFGRFLFENREKRISEAVVWKNGIFVLRGIIAKFTVNMPRICVFDCFRIAQIRCCLKSTTHGECARNANKCDFQRHLAPAFTQNNKPRNNKQRNSTIPETNLRLESGRNIKGNLQRRFHPLPHFLNIFGKKGCIFLALYKSTSVRRLYLLLSQNRKICHKLRPRAKKNQNC